MLSCALGMGSEQVMVTAPAAVVLYDWVFRAESFASLARKRLGLYIGLAVTWGILAALMWSSIRMGTAGFSMTADRTNYALNQILMVSSYLRLAVWPHPLLLD